MEVEHCRIEEALKMEELCRQGAEGNRREQMEDYQNVGEGFHTIIRVKL
jgi:hypothetical protein